MNPNESKQAGLSSLLELREIISSELDKLEGNTQARTFQPLSPGLGLESPARPTPAPPKRAMAKLLDWEDATEAPPPPEPPPREPTRVVDVDIEEADASLDEEEEREVATAAKVEARVDAVPTPPPLPKASVFRRMCAAFIDEVFVLSIWFIALFLTLKLIAGGEFLSLEIRHLQNPLFVRFAALEFTTLWLAYLAIGVGVLDMKFGMWVWGLRIQYAENDTEGIVLYKLARILLSFLFYAPIAPLILLLFQRRQRNMLDALSGTSVYRTMV